MPQPRASLNQTAVRREFTINLALLLAINAVIKPLYLFGIDLGVQNAVGTEEYGHYATWYSFALLFAVVYDLGLHNYNAVSLSKAPETLRDRFPLLLSLKLGLSLLFIAVVLVAAAAYGAQARQLRLALLAGLYLAMLSVVQLLRTNLGAQGKYRINSYLSGLDKALLIVGLGLVLWIPGWSDWLTVEWFYVAQLLALAVAGVATLAATTFPKDRGWLRWNTKEARALVVSAYPYGLVLLLTVVYTRVDIVMVEALAPQGRGAYEAGVYAAAYRLLDAGSTIGILLASLLVPMLTKLVADKQPVGPLLRQGGGVALSTGVGLAAWTTFNSNAITELLYTEAAAASGEVLAILMWALVGIGLTYVYGSYLLACGRLRILNTLFAGALLANVLLNVWLIPIYGPVGAAAATVGTQCFVGGVELWLSRQPGQRDGWWWRLPVYAGLVLATAYWCTPAAFGVMGSLGIQIFVCGAVGLATGLLADPRELWQRIAKVRS